MCGALLLGLFVGFLARAIIPNDAFQGLKGPASWGVSILLGLVGAALGWLIFTKVLGIGDEDIWDWGGVLSALIGTIIVVGLASWIMRSIGKGRGGGTGTSRNSGPRSAR